MVPTPIYIYISCPTLIRPVSVNSNRTALSKSKASRCYVVFINRNDLERRSDRVSNGNQSATRVGKRS